MTKQEFIEKGLFQVDEFDHEGNEYVLYKMNANNPTVYITGARYEWQIGLVYEKSLGLIVQPYFIEDELRHKIEYALKGQ